MEEGGQRRMDLERTVLDVVNAAEERGDPPLVWAVEVGRCVQARGLELPSVELGEVVVGSLCFANNRPSLWKFLDQAIASGLVSPLHALALLTTRYFLARHLSVPRVLAILSLCSFPTLECLCAFRGELACVQQPEHLAVVIVCGVHTRKHSKNGILCMSEFCSFRPGNCLLDCREKLKGDRHSNC